jgi:hypothetical protein
MKFYKGDKVSCIDDTSSSSDPCIIGKQYTVAKDAECHWVTLDGKTGTYNITKFKACNRRKHSIKL